MIPLLNSLSNMLEREEAKYQIGTTDPDDEEARHDHTIGHLIDTMNDLTMENDLGMVVEADIYEMIAGIALRSRESDAELCTEAIRALAASTVWEFPRGFVMADHDDQLVNLLVARVSDESADSSPGDDWPHPARVFATQALAALAKETDTASAIVGKGIAGPVIRRLVSKYFPIFGGLFLSTAGSEFPTPANLGTFNTTTLARAITFPPSPAATPSPPLSPRAAHAPRSTSVAATTTTVPEEAEQETRPEDRIMRAPVATRPAQGEGHHADSEDEVERESEDEDEPIEEIPDVKTSEIPKETLRRLEVRALLNLLTAIAEYQEIVPSVFEGHGFDLILAFLRSMNAYLLLDTFKLVGKLMAHKKVGGTFAERGGLQLLLTAPHTPFLAGAVGSCFAGLAANASVMEQICLLPNPYPSNLVKLGLWLLQTTDTAKKTASSFFSSALTFRTTLELFESMHGLQAVTNLLKASIARKYLIHVDLTVLCCMRQYFRARYLLFANSLHREATRATTGEILPPIPGYKPVDTGANAMLEAARSIEEYRKFRGGLVRLGHWPHVDTFLKIGGVGVLLDIFAMSQNNDGARALSGDIAQHAMETLHAVLINPHAHAALLSFASEPDATTSRTGMGLVLDACNSNERPEVIAAALHVIASCVNRQIIAQAQKKPHVEQQDSTQQAQQDTTAPAPQEPFRVPAAPPTTPSGRRSITGMTTTPQAASTMPAPAVAAAAQGTTSQVEPDEVLRKAWRSVRSHNGVKVLLGLLKYRKNVRHADQIRELACKALLGMSRDPTMPQILGKLQVCSTLTELMQEPVHPEGMRHHAEFRHYAVELMARIIGQTSASLVLDATDTTHRKMERAAVVSQTSVTYEPAQLLRIVHDHLLASGLAKSARALAEEANLAVGGAEAAPSAASTTKLNDIVTRYLRNQHELCHRPIAVPPPFSLTEQHRCPEPNVPLSAGNAPTSIAARLLARQLLPRLRGGVGGRAFDNRFVFSRFRPWRYVRESPDADEDDYWFPTCTSFLTREWGRLLVGMQSGEVKLFNIQTSEVIKSWQAFDARIGWLQLSPDGARLAVSSAADEYGAASETKIWDATDFARLQEPAHVLPGVYATQFSHDGCTLLGTTGSGRATVYSVETGAALRTLSDPASARRDANSDSACARDAIARFSPCDDLVLDDNLLWDPRAPRLLHRFDKFTASPSGYFNCCGTGVIINSEVWDLRTLKLVNTCPYFMRASLEFNSTGEVAYALARPLDERIASKEPFQPFFHTVNTSDYSLISATHLERDIWHMAIDPRDEFLSVIEGDPDRQDTASIRIYEVGRSRGDGDDDDDDGTDGSMHGSSEGESDEYGSEMSDFDGDLGSWDEDADDFADRLLEIAGSSGSEGEAMEFSSDGELAVGGDHDHEEEAPPVETAEEPAAGEEPERETRPASRRRRRGRHGHPVVFEERRIDEGHPPQPPPARDGSGSGGNEGAH